MDNLDIMISNALSESCEPDEYLINRTLTAIFDNRRQSVTAINLILLVNALGMALAGLIMFLLPGNIKIAGLFLLLSWLAAIIPVYVIARSSLKTPK